MFERVIAIGCSICKVASSCQKAFTSVTMIPVPMKKKKSVRFAKKPVIQSPPSTPLANCVLVAAGTLVKLKRDFEQAANDDIEASTGSNPGVGTATQNVAIGIPVSIPPWHYHCVPPPWSYGVPVYPPHAAIPFPPGPPLTCVKLQPLPPQGRGQSQGRTV